MVIHVHSFQGNDEAQLGAEGEVKYRELAPQQDAAVDLPASLFQRIDNQTNVGIFFMLYEMPTLFPVENEDEVDDESINTEVGSPILSVTVGNGLKFKDLANNITIVFRLSAANVSQLYNRVKILYGSSTLHHSYRTQCLVQNGVCRGILTIKNGSLMAVRPVLARMASQLAAAVISQTLQFLWSVKYRDIR